MPDPEAAVALPFDGIRVLDLAAPVSAMCGRVLAGYGASVVRIESPRRPPRDEGDRRGAWLDAWYAAGCRSVTLDVTDEQAVPLLAELAATVDVVVASPTAATPVVGFVADPLALSWCPASVVTCLLTPFGATGPLRDWRVTPLTAHAMSGLMYPVGPQDGPPVAMPGRQHWDEAGVRAATCIVAALHERQWVGGQVLDVSAHEVATSQDDVIHRFDVAGLVVRRLVNFGVPPSGTWPVADGMVDIAVNTPAHWEAFVKTMGSPAELTDPMWEDRAMRMQLHDVLGEAVAALLRDRHRDQLVADGQANGLPCSAANTPEQFVADQRADERRPLGSLRHPTLGTCDVPGPPLRVDGRFHERDLVAPVIGADTDDVLGSELGHTAVELEAWREVGLV
jgi:crotonobetainyl-CoA:carnitine CoA-transferase CaiB-like acyl-CoA transferase